MTMLKNKDKYAKMPGSMALPNDAKPNSKSLRSRTFMPLTVSAISAYNSKPQTLITIKYKSESPIIVLKNSVRLDRFPTSNNLDVAAVNPN